MEAVAKVMSIVELRKKPDNIAMRASGLVNYRSTPKRKSRRLPSHMVIFVCKKMADEGKLLPQCAVIQFIAKEEIAVLDKKYNIYVHTETLACALAV